MTRMTSFIDVQRRFHDLTEKELEDTESLLALSEYDFGPAVGWSDLLEDDRVVLLAEAGAGKTMEMSEQAKRLAGEGRFAFFVPLESLDREAIARECANRYAAEPAGVLALGWIRGLFRFDAVRGTQALAAELVDPNDPATRARAIDTLAALFGERDTPLPAFETIDPARRGHLLGQIVRHAYAFVRPEDDQVHEGVYTQDARDKAEIARNFLLSKLLDTSGPEARRVVLELADEDDFAHFRDRLRLLARQRAAADAEFPPLSTGTVPPRGPDCPRQAP